MKPEETIKVTALPEARRFPSIAAAVRHAISHPLLTKAKVDAEQLRGQSFVDASWTLFEWHLRFSGDLGLRIWIKDDEISWNLAPMKTLPIQGFQTVGAPPVALNWWRTIGCRSMDASIMVSSRNGALFKDLFYSDHGLFVYLDGSEILHFGLARRELDGRYLIYVEETD